ncbi:5-hydroxytryptamine receptor 1D [Sitodiplosis mosellana]|uniref:5-hydroxytryptamine receptor 1D n=1 Tax=Sitodiplosis mosellana TaxID=263140 RepID=UPI0024445980|nr:5-hydroxytryptamine receptor 1D [Sitodiplosis mosellana]
MDLKSGTYLTAPNIKNVSCTHERYTHPLYYYIGPLDVIQALIIFLLTIGIIGANLMLIFVINHRRYSPYIDPQPRYLLTSLALNDFAIGILITPLGILPALFHCWPYGEIFCQIQALLRGALCQQSAVILICMAVDRYMCALHAEKYQMHSSKKGCVALLSLTWTLCLTVFGFLVLPKGYYFNETGLLICEPFYSKPSYRILATCSLYFPTTMILMYCYGSSFHASRLRLVIATPSAMMQQTRSIAMSQTETVTRPIAVAGNTILPSPTEKNVDLQERRISGSVSRTMAAMSLGFIVMVTPWSIQEVVAACTGSKLPPFLEFLVTWTAISNSFWNPFLYWLLNAHFRRLTKELLVLRCCLRGDTTSEQKLRCCSVSSECNLNGLAPAGPSRPVSSLIPPQTDYDTLSEKYWGEILERTVSSSSLQTLRSAQQRTYNIVSEHPFSSTMQSAQKQIAANGQQHQLHCLKSSGIELNYRHPSMQTTNTSTKQTHFNHHPVRFENDTKITTVTATMATAATTPSTMTTHLSSFSTSEPHLCEQFVHDINCAKNKNAYLNQAHNGQPDN